MLSHFDTTIHLSDIILLGGGLLAFIKFGWTMRDGLRDVVTAVGGLNRKVDFIEGRTEEHHEWLMANGLYERRVNDRRTPSGQHDRLGT